MTLADYLKSRISRAAHAWCECGYKWSGERAHADAHAHGNREDHIVHVWEPDEDWCADVLDSGLSRPVACSAPRGHQGQHESQRPGGTTIYWANRGVDNPVESVENS